MNSQKFFRLIHTKQSVQFSKHRAQPKGFEYIDTIVGMQLDQRSY